MCINVAFERFTVRTSDCGQKSNQSIRDTLVVFSGLTELIRNACKMFQFLLKLLRVKNNIFRIFFSSTVFSFIRLFKDRYK